MKYLKILFPVLLLLVAGKSMGQSKTAAEITALSKQRAAWLVAGRLDSLATLYDAHSITVHGNGLIKSTAEHFEDIRQGRPVYKSIKLGESTVREFGNTAVLVGKGDFHIAMNGQDLHCNMVYTEVYKKDNNRWKLIARQAVQQNP